MQSSFHILLIGTLAITMVTSAPMSNQEKLVNADQTGEAVDRAKRANEEIVFGNQQNKPRVVAKKSDLSNILAPPQLQGERDQGSEVIVHQVEPVNEDLAARAEAAAGSASENNEKMKDAVEAAIQSVVEAEKAQAESSGQEAADKTDSEEKVAVTADEEIEENEQGTGEMNDAADVEKDVVEDLRDLQRADENVVAEGGSDTEDSDNGESSPQVNDEVEQFLQESPKGDDAREAELDRDREKSFREYNMRNYWAPLNNERRFPYFLPVLSREVRSIHSSKNAKGSNNKKRGRRIKRDLLDDSYYGPYDFHDAPYTPEDVDDALISNPDELVPLSDDEAEYLYKQLVNYLANGYAPEQEEPSLDETPLDSYLNGYEETQNEPYTPYDIYNEDSAPLVSSPYKERYQYSPVDFDSYQNYVKRGMIDYYPREEEEKRYFFPFSKEPETHWGAFVPEKRDYGEAIQRLQRLAMALSDNPGPYYREMLEEYRRR